MAINHFLDCSVVLPPSEMDADELLHSVARFQREMLRKREEQQSVRLQEKQSIAQLDHGWFFHLCFAFLVVICWDSTSLHLSVLSCSPPRSFQA